MRTLITLLSAALLFVGAANAAPPDASAQARQIDDLAALRFERLGHPALRWDAIPPVEAPASRPHRLLVVLVEFADQRFDRFAGDPAQPQKLVEHYTTALFDPTYQRVGTLSHFYRDQSLGLYHLQGLVLPPVRLDKPLAAYGAPTRPAGGDWRDDVAAEQMVVDALGKAVKANPDLDWPALDVWDPGDADGDGLRGEPDGYLDHLVLVYAGGGQSSCHGLFKLGEVFTPNVGPEVLDTLPPAARDCANRLWPHRFVVAQGEGTGPVVEGRANARGGVELRPGLWARDYNMQPEYIDVSTFAHEFGHSIGLPDIYARTSSNSTGPWAVMSGTADPLPQNFTAWSRLMLGWLRPKIIRPPAFGGEKVQSVYLRTLDDAPDAPDRARDLQAAGVWRAALVALPPKTRVLDVAPLPKGRALYSGQGNDLNRIVELRVDLRDKQGPVRLSFAAFWSIEAGWDFAYLETSTDDGHTWTRRLPEDRRFMPAKHGHDGEDTLPGFTGLSGDFDGDGKNENHKGCDPKKPLAHGEERAGLAVNPCELATWVRPRFALDDLAGHQARVRLRYFTDMAAVMPGILIDDVKLEVGGKALIDENFDDNIGRAWRLDGFIAGTGRYEILVPHYYLLEFRDPYGAGYDQQIAYRPALRFWYDPQAKVLRAVRIRPRPGVVAWYADGAHAWSENDPAEHRQGHGFLLALDAWPNELALPGLDGWMTGDAAHFDTGYKVDTPEAQAAIEDGFHRMTCFVRDASYRALDLPKDRCARPDAGVAALRFEGLPLMYSYRLLNDILPGPEREAFWPASELLDYRKRGDAITWRLRDRSLRHVHTFDAPFALDDFPDGVELYEVRDGKLVRTGSRPHPAVPRFHDGDPARWANPKLYFGGVAVPDVGFGFELARPKADAPKPARVKVYFTWDR
ncbi:MAG: immune inhibitor A [Myxococcales bacterium]|nr:immune inhibitor A [Myxococcales bacterium]